MKRKDFYIHNSIKKRNFIDKDREQNKSPDVDNIKREEDTNETL